MTLFTTQEADAYDDAEQRDIDCGKALKNNSMVCPACGMGMVYNSEDNKYHCMGVNNGCFHSERK